MKQLISFFLVVVLCNTGCVKEDHFGLSHYGNIKTIEIYNQASQAVFNNSTLEIDIEFPSGVDLSELEISTLTLSSFATADKTVGDKLDLNSPAVIQVTAEDGTVYNWTVTANVASSNPQVDNSDFNNWYQTSSGYFEPGTDAATAVWGTGNPGTNVLNLYATTRVEVSSGNYAARLETLDNGLLAGTFGTPISAGSIFTGKFNADNIDPSNPDAAIDFGTPFIGRPTAFKFSYQYTPGDVNKDVDGNILPYGDACDIYALLEVRNGDESQRLATAWFRGTEVQAETATQQLDFVYGELDSSYPDYMQPSNGEYVSAEAAEYILPTHITIVVSSSYNGNGFAGAIGSLLLIDDVEMVY